ncbi:MAG TPA: tetratricopeptide repeat protein, partial [Pyrinomonadaceae bacterium]|nr:tetratricopeptide repeat protein [Pyrinomonadaceae bacterium]
QHKMNLTRKFLALHLLLAFACSLGQTATAQDRSPGTKSAKAGGAKSAGPKSTGAKSKSVKNSKASDSEETDGDAASAPSEEASKERPAASSDDPDKAELNAALALPPAERIEKLKAFIEAHPRSALKTRAAELIISARASLGDDKLRAGDTTGGVEQFRLAIAESQPNMSDKLFNEVVSQFPLNLFLRGERAAALEVARLIEAKVKDHPQRLLAIAAYYLKIEEVDESARIAQLVINLAPDSASAHYSLGAAHHIALRLDEAAAEYARALELDPQLALARRSLADLRRASGKAEEALTLYREQLRADSSDKLAQTGVILSLFELGKREEAEQELAAALKDEPRNLPLLVGAAYWYVAHDEHTRALELAQKAVELEPRYTWAQIALARALTASKRPLAAESALRFARQYGRFPTLDYELASALSAAGLYEEAAAALTRSFTLKDDRIEAHLAGRIQTRAASFIELLAPERRASIFQPVAADSEKNARLLKGLLAFNAALNPPGGREAIDEASLLAAAQEFTAGEDEMRAYRQLYVASRLLQSRVALQKVLDLTEAAKDGVEAALDAPTAPVAIQADELSPIYARAVSSGIALATTDVERNFLSKILRGRIEDIAGWALFNQDQAEQAVTRLRRAVSVFPENSTWWRNALWHLGAALDASGNHQEALDAYLKSYNSNAPDATQRVVIEALYRKVNGSLDGLDAKIGPSPSVAMVINSADSTPPQMPATTENTSAEAESKAETAPVVNETPEAVASPTPAPTPTPTPVESPTIEAPPAAAPEITPEPTPTPTPTPTPEPTPESISVPDATASTSTTSDATLASPPANEQREADDTDASAAATRKRRTVEPIAQMPPTTEDATRASLPAKPSLPVPPIEDTSPTPRDLEIEPARLLALTKEDKAKVRAALSQLIKVTKLWEAGERGQFYEQMKVAGEDVQAALVVLPYGNLRSSINTAWLAYTFARITSTIAQEEADPQQISGEAVRLFRLDGVPSELREQHLVQFGQTSLSTAVQMAIREKVLPANTPVPPTLQRGRR